jgi:hypothetical protein
VLQQDLQEVCAPVPAADASSHAASEELTEEERKAKEKADRGKPITQQYPSLQVSFGTLSTPLRASQMKISVL